MKTTSILSVAIVSAGHLLVAGSLAAPAVAQPGPPDLVRIQALQQPQVAISDRMMRLREHRAIIEGALAPGEVMPQPQPEPQAEPQPRTLQPPEPMVPTAPQALALEPNAAPVGEGDGQVSCEAAADIVADYGFSDIRTSDCSGDLYRFSAMRDGTAYSIAITAVAGEITEVSRQ